MATGTDIVRKSIRIELPVPLTEREEVEVSRAKAKLEGELEELRAEFADTKRSWSNRLDDHEKRIAALGAELRTGTQRRVVECYERYVKHGEHAGKIERVRSDTDEVVERRVADLLEARQAVPREDDDDATEPASAGLIADAERAQAAAGVEEDEDGDVVVPDAAAKKSKAKGSVKKRSKRA